MDKVKDKAMVKNKSNSFDIMDLVRENIKRLKPYTSARDSYSEGILLDANENPFGPVFFDDQFLQLNRYPDPKQKVLRNELSKIVGVRPDKLFFGVGSDEIIDLLIRIFCNPGEDTIGIPEPTYGMYQVCADINNVQTVSPLLDDDFQPIIETLVQEKPHKVIFLCSPNNPTGGLLNRERLETLLNTTRSIIVIDEAYIDFAECGSLADLVETYPQLVILRTFSKAWGMAGARIGYCIATPAIINILFTVKAPYTINKFTEQAVLKALKQKPQRDKYIKAIKEEKKRLISAISLFPFVEEVYNSDANFFLFKTDDANKLHKYLAAEGVIIRNRSTQPMLEGCLRVSVGAASENTMLIEKMLQYSNEFKSKSTSEELVNAIAQLLKQAAIKIPLPTARSPRIAYIQRKTKETDIEVTLDLDNQVEGGIDTGIGFFDHMLDQIRHHGNIGLSVKVKGDLHIDEHHTVEDTGIALGEALLKALGEKKGIRRYGFLLPMDDCVAKCGLDLGGRAHLNFKVKFSREMVGEFPVELTEEFFRAVANALKANIYLRAKGKNDHHKIESLFKAFSRSLNEACRYDDRREGKVPSSKGVL